MEKLALVSSLPSPILAKSPKKVKDITTYFKKNNNSKGKETSKKSYVQTLSNSNITKDTFKIKKAFPKLQGTKIKSIQKIINRSKKPKLYLNMTTKGPTHKQVIIPVDSNNTNKFMLYLSDHITNINRLLKNIKSNCRADYIRAEKLSIIITTNKVALSLDLQTLGNYIKNANQINVDKVKTPHLPQLKSYLKLISLSYYTENTNLFILLDDIEKVLKNNHIFNNISLVSCLRIIKVSPKLDMAII